jgi:thiaminase/transcriptional activator TenA
MSERFTDELRALAGEKWDAVIKHKFTDELAAGIIDDKVLARYLIQDHRFLDSFVVLLASMVAAAPTLADRIPGCQFLALITGRENTYFERSFEALGVDEAARVDTPDAAPTAAFNALMREAATKSYPEMLAVLVVAEWSYQSWGERVLPVAVKEPFTCREWVDLHSGEYFGSVVEYLRGLLDRAGATLGEPERAAVQAAFLKAVDIEIAFFDNAYAS